MACALPVELRALGTIQVSAALRVWATISDSVRSQLLHRRPEDCCSENIEGRVLSVDLQRCATLASEINAPPKREITTLLPPSSLTTATVFSGDWFSALHSVWHAGTSAVPAAVSSGQLPGREQGAVGTGEGQVIVESAKAGLRELRRPQMQRHWQRGEYF